MLAPIEERLHRLAAAVRLVHPNLSFERWTYPPPWQPLFFKIAAGVSMLLLLFPVYWWAQPSLWQPEIVRIAKSIGLLAFLGFKSYEWLKDDLMRQHARKLQEVPPKTPIPNQSYPLTAALHTLLERRHNRLEQAVLGAWVALMVGGVVFGWIWPPTAAYVAMPVVFGFAALWAVAYGLTIWRLRLIKAQLQAYERFLP